MFQVKPLITDKYKNPINHGLLWIIDICACIVNIEIVLLVSFKCVLFGFKNRSLVLLNVKLNIKCKYKYITLLSTGF